MPIVPIAKELGHYQRTIKIFLMNPSPKKKKRSGAGSSKIKTDQNLRRIHRAMSANTGKNSGSIFDVAGLKYLPKSTGNKVLRGMGKTFHLLKSRMPNTVKREYNEPKKTHKITNEMHFVYL